MLSFKPGCFLGSNQEPFQPAPFHDEALKYAAMQFDSIFLVVGDDHCGMNVVFVK